MENYLQMADELSKNAGLNAKSAGVVKGVAAILDSAGVTVTNRVEGGVNAEGVEGASGVPALDEPKEQPNGKELLEKLVAYLQLEDEKRHLQMALQRIEMNKAFFEAEHNSRMGGLGRFMAMLGDPSALSRRERAGMEWLTGRALDLAEDLEWAASSGGWLSRFCAAIAMRHFLEDLTGEYVSFCDARELVDSMVDGMRETGIEGRAARGVARNAVGIAMMSMLVAGGGLHGLRHGNLGAGELMAVMKMAVVTSMVDAFAEKALGLGHGHRAMKMDPRELNALMTAMQQRLEENGEKLTNILMQLTSGLAGVLDLISSVNETGDEIEMFNNQTV